MECARATQGRVRLPAAMLILAGAAILGISGCEDAVRHPVAYHPIQNPAPAPPSVGQLPLEPARARVPMLAMTPPDGVGRLAKQVGDVFQAGQDDAKAGNLAGAREDFDLALNLLQASGFDVQAEPRLATLSKQILAATQSQATAAVPETDAASERPAAPAPMDEITGLMFSPDGIPEGPVDPRLRTRVEGELQNVPHDLPLTVNDSVLSFLNFFQTTHGRAIVETGLRRAGRYRPMIERVLREEGLPSDLMYMAQAESAFQPQALSRAGARGLWQFMSFRGKEYGLEHSWWVDDRQDPEKATRAAAHHLRDLYNLFGDWYLAMAAYDSGPGAVQHAVERTGYADFWELYKRNALPKETRNYVPIILALTLIAKDPARYGMDVEPEEPLRTESVQAGHPIDLRLVSETIDVDLETLRALNPELLRLATPADPGFVLNLPEGTAERFNSEMAAIPPDKWLTWRRHTVEEGETLLRVAAKYRVGTAAIADANGLDVHAPLDVGEKLIIPLAAETQPSFGKLVRYRVHGNDTLETIADEFDVSTAELKKWNRLRSNKVARGVRLSIYPGGLGPPPTAGAAAKAGATPETKAAAAKSPGISPVKASETGTVTHRVQAGETLWSIAQAYRTTVDALRSGNRFLFSRSLQAGDTLMILPPH
jgi:membrane-bound lytic murein transglycosylase D